MTKHMLNWRLPASNEIDGYYKGSLLSRIMDMKKKAPISMEDAIRLLEKYERAASAAGRVGTDPGHVFWYAFNFVEWLSELGFHIELTGDEFEPFLVQATAT